MLDPKIYLTIDNCFASKRWVDPAEWSRVVRDLGLRYVEASADNDCDPFHLPPDSLQDWVAATRAAQRTYGTRVANLYSGHGTYVTLGLTHPDARVREHFRDDWLKPMLDIAAELGAGLGFFCHALSQAVLAAPQRYALAESQLIDDLAELARYGHEVGAGLLGLEQMRSPHLPPWTIAGSLDLLKRVYAVAGVPFYLTVDVTHATGQRRCLRPSLDELAEAIIRARAGESMDDLWLGGEPAYAAWREIVAGDEAPSRAAQRVNALLDAYPYMFAVPQDGDPYAWLGSLAGYSPIIHLSQTSGHDAAHSPFTAAKNAEGIIAPRRVLEAIAAAYAQPAAEGLPPLCAELYLTLEIFPATVDTPPQIIRDLQESVACWRAHIPEDGLSLSQLLA